jgi:hypothetical protein
MAGVVHEVKTEGYNNFHTKNETIRLMVSFTIYLTSSTKRFFKSIGRCLLRP